MTDSIQSIIDQVQSARSAGTKLQIMGANSKHFMGRNIECARLEMKQHTGIVSYQPVELVLTARSGTPLGEIEAVLAEQGQMLSFEPPQYNSEATIGGTLACNLSGPSRPWWGSVRDQVLGIRLINGKAEHLRFGGQVMKNVAGYDVSRLQAGAMGSLGIITEISFKVMPKPAFVMTLVEDMDGDRAIKMMNSHSRQPKPLSAACWLDGRLYLRLAGARSAVESTARQWGYRELEDGNTFWRNLRDQQLEFFSGDIPLWRFSVKSTAAHHNSVADNDAQWLIDWGGSQRWLRKQGELKEMESIAESMSGQVSLFKGGNRQSEVFHRQPEPLKIIQQRIKQTFDPDGIFNPGRLYSWL